jgi:flagellin-specific chaperone FliS
MKKGEKLIRLLEAISKLQGIIETHQLDEELLNDVIENLEEIYESELKELGK